MSDTGPDDALTVPTNPAVLVACDLDRTLIYSPRALWLETPDDEAPTIVVAEIYQGVPISFLTRAAEKLLDALTRSTTFVPATTRTVAQYRRVQLPGAVPEYAVTSNGGVLLHRGTADAAWAASVAAETAASCAPLPEVEALLLDPSAAPWILRVHQAEGLFLYAIVERDLMPEHDLEALRMRCETLGWRVSVQGRKLYCVPNPVTKSAAVAEVQRRTGASTVLAAGDSLLDQGMLEAATLAFRPAHGELDDAGWTAPHLTVTSSRGVLAGEELLRLLTAAAHV